MKKLLKTLLKIVPQNMRSKIYRNSLNIEQKMLNGVIFKVAESKEEIEEALRLVQQRYQETKLVNRTGSELRVTKYHASPFSSILIGKSNDKIICTLSILLDSPLGIPADQAIDLSSLRKNGQLLAEISSLAVARNTAYSKGTLLLHFLKYMWCYVMEYTAADNILCSVRQSAAEYYQGLLLFEKLNLPKANGYSFVAYSKPLVLQLDISTAEQKYKGIYANKVNRKNLYKFFTEHKFANFLFPENNYCSHSQPKLTPNLMKYFLVEKSSILEKLTPIEEVCLSEIYFYEKYKSLFLGKNSVKFLAKRKQPRFLFKTQVTIRENNISAQVRWVSQNGLMLKVEQKFQINSEIHINIKLPNKTDATLKCLVLWTENNFLGLQTFYPPEPWTKFIAELDRNINLDPYDLKTA